MSLGKSHGWRSLVGCSPWSHEESDMTEWLHFHFSLSCIGEGNGNPLQCSCLENPRDRGASWAAVYGVAQSRTRLKWFSSSRLVIAFLPRSKASFNFMAEVTICSDFGALKNKVSHCFHCFPIYLSWSDGTRCWSRFRVTYFKHATLVVLCYW